MKYLHLGRVGTSSFLLVFHTIFYELSETGHFELRQIKTAISEYSTHPFSCYACRLFQELVELVQSELGQLKLRNES